MNFEEFFHKHILKITFIICLPLLTAWTFADEIEEIVGKVDIMRWELLYRYGGIFIDADSICIESIDDVLLKTSLHHNINISTKFHNSLVLIIYFILKRHLVT